MTGNSVKHLREQLGWPASALAALTGVRLSTVYRWEHCGPDEVPIEPFQAGLLEHVRQALECPGDERDRRIVTIRRALDNNGPFAGLYVLLFYTVAGKVTVRRRRKLKRKTRPSA